MKKSTRSLLFFSFLATFLIIAPAIIAYSQGYRIHWENKTIVKAGALFLEPRPAPVELYLNDEFKRESNFVFQNMFIGNLIPKTYSIEIKKVGYGPWKKKLQVHPKLVTEVKNIILFPLTPKISQLRQGVKNFWLSGNNKYTLYAEDKNVPKLVVGDSETKHETLLFAAPKTLRNIEIKNIRWNKDSERLLFTLENKFDKKWNMIELTASEAKTKPIAEEIKEQKTFTQYISGASNPVIDNLNWYPEESAVILFTVKNLLFSYNVETKKLSEPLAYDVLSYAIWNRKIFYISSMLETINSLDLATNKIEQVSFNPIPEGNLKTNTLDVLPVNEQKLLLLLGDDPSANPKLLAVYLFDKTAGGLKKVSGPLNYVEVSSDKKRVLLLYENKIKVYWLEDVHIQPFRDSGDVENIYETEERLIDAVWFTKDNEHIIFSQDTGTSIVELDGRDQHNIHTLSDKAATNMQYDQESENLYFISDDNFYSLSLK